MAKPVGLIVAMTPEGVIGVNNTIPWKHPADMRRFKQLTMGGTLIMGRKTFESMGRRHLPGRISFVVSSTPQPGASTFPSVEAALAAGQRLGQPIWFIGGSQIYAEVLEKGLVDFADVTLVPSIVVPEGAVVATFPMMALSAGGFRLEKAEKNPDDPVEHRRYTR